jgi:diguanylate cyclase (GGDEF)-like protein
MAPQNAAMRAIFQRLTRCPNCALAATGISFAAAIVVLFLVDLQSRHRDAVAAATQSARNFAEVLAEHTARTFEGVDRALGEAALIHRSNGPDPSVAVRDALRHLQQTSPLIVGICWTDAAGDVLAHSYERDPPRRNIADMPHFMVQRNKGDGNLFIGAPFRSVATGEWRTAASRGLRNADGSFVGVVMAVLDQSHFAGIYRSIHLGKNGSVLLLHRDGMVLAREPVVASAIGKSFADGPLLTRYLPQAQSGSFESTSVVDGAERIAGYKAVPNLPLVVVVTYHRADVLEHWHRHLYTFGPIVAALVVIILIGTAMLARQANILAGKTRELESANARFKVAIDNMSQGLAMFDGDSRIIVSNERYATMYGLSPDDVKPGTAVSEIYERRIKKGIFAGPSPDRYQPKRAKSANVASDWIDELSDGRSILISHQPMAEGGWVTTHEDITERRRGEARIAFMAHYDPLTGLANRAFFLEKIEEAGARLRRWGEPFTVFMLDLDRFKGVNDSLGHAAGDALLKETAMRLKSALRETDVVARLGGDEFAIIQSGEIKQREGAIGLANRILRAITEPYDINGTEVCIGTSIGVALAPQDGLDAGDLMKKADLALYETKSEGRDGFRLYHPRMIEKAQTRHHLEKDLREAISRKEFELHYQPIIDVATRRPIGVEALVRWRHPQDGLLPPIRFIPLAEETGLIVPLGEWVLRKACADAATWPPHIKVAVNLSAVQFKKSDLLNVVLGALRESGLAPGRLELEITETVLLESEINLLDMMRQLKNLGVTIALDDFGTGYSSLSYLAMYPIDKIKIDKSFTQGLTRRPECAAIVSSVTTLGYGLDITTAAEGVETEQQFRLLHAAGVNVVQGYLFGRPCPISELDFDRVGDDRRAESAA